jgi:hypothetical protein
MSSFTLGTPAIYRIRIAGYLNPGWAGSFGEMTISHQITVDGSPHSVLTGRLVDQAALFGVLDNLYGLGFPLVLVECVDINQGKQVTRVPESD